MTRSDVECFKCCFENKGNKKSIKINEKTTHQSNKFVKQIKNELSNMFEKFDRQNREKINAPLQCC